jgi:hypothetical protein
MSDAKIETMVMITGREYEALRAEVAWHVEDKNAWQDTQAAHLREVTRLTARVKELEGVLANIRSFPNFSEYYGTLMLDTLDAVLSASQPAQEAPAP